MLIERDMNEFSWRCASPAEAEPEQAVQELAAPQACVMPGLQTYAEASVTGRPADRCKAAG